MRIHSFTGSLTACCPARQRGFLLIAAVVLIVAAALLLTVMVFLGAAGTMSSAGHSQSGQALFVAESGIERALYGFTREGAACGSLNYSAGFGQGSFSTVGTLYAPAATTLSAAISATDTVIPVASVADYAPHGRVTVGSEFVHYAGTSSSSCGAFSPPCFTGAARGAGGSTAAAHALGEAVSQNQCLIRSVGTVGSAERTVETAVTPTKNVQSGSVTMNSVTRDVTLATPVNTTRSFVVCYNRVDSSNPTRRVTCELTNATTVRVTASVADSANVVQWYVVEFSSGMTVQRGLATFCANPPGPPCVTVNVTLPQAVTLARTFVLVTERINDANQGRDERWTVRARLTSTTNLELTRNEGSNVPLSVAWQVIEMNDAAVQSGLTTILDGAFSNTATITAVDPTRSFLVFSRRAANDVDGVEGCYQVRGELTNGTTLTFTRALDERQIDIAWFVVTLNDGTTVQRGTAAAAAGTNTANVTLAPAVVLNQSFPIISASGEDNGNARGDLDSTSWTPAFTSTTNLRLQRTPAGSGDQIDSSVAWFAINLGGSTRIDWQEVFP